MVSEYLCRVSSQKWSCRVKYICNFNFDRYCQIVLHWQFTNSYATCDGWERLFPHSLTKQHTLLNFYIFSNILGESWHISLGCLSFHVKAICISFFFVNCLFRFFPLFLLDLFFYWIEFFLLNLFARLALYVILVGNIFLNLFYFILFS